MVKSSLTFQEGRVYFTEDTGQAYKGTELSAGLLQGSRFHVTFEEIIKVQEEILHSLGRLTVPSPSITSVPACPDMCYKQIPRLSDRKGNKHNSVKPSSTSNSVNIITNICY